MKNNLDMKADELYSEIDDMIADLKSMQGDILVLKQNIRILSMTDSSNMAVLCTREDVSNGLKAIENKKFNFKNKYN